MAIIKPHKTVSKTLATKKQRSRPEKPLSRLRIKRQERHAVRTSKKITVAKKPSLPSAQPFDYTALLPDELLLSIFDLLPEDERLKLGFVDKRWRNVSGDKTFWAPKCQPLWRSSKSHTKVMYYDESWPDYYHRLYTAQQKELPNTAKAFEALGIVQPVVYVHSQQICWDDRCAAQLNRMSTTQQGKDALLLAATRAQSVTLIRQALDIGANVNTQDAQGDSPLHIAWRYRDDSMFTLLIHAGADIDIGNKRQRTCLHLAVIGDPFEFPVISTVPFYSWVEYLLEQGANPDVADENGLTPLFHAGILTADTLLAHGATVNAATRDGCTPLLYVAGGGSVSVSLCSLLLENGADVDCVSKYDGDTPLLCAVDSGSLKISRLLLENGANVDYVNKCDGTTPLLRAAAKGDGEMCRLLLEHRIDVDRADVDCTDSRGDTPLLIAAREGYGEVCERLLLYFAEVDCTDQHGYTPLALAKDESVVEHLLDLSRPNPDCQDRNGLTPLHRLDSLPNIQRLLDANATVDMRDNQGETPLHRISRRKPQSRRSFIHTREKDTQKAALLIRYGADIHARNNAGFTPIDIAVRSNARKHARLLTRNGAHLRFEHCYRAASVKLAGWLFFAWLKQKCVAMIRGSFSLAKRGVNHFRSSKNANNPMQAPLANPPQAFAVNNPPLVNQNEIAASDNPDVGPDEAAVASRMCSVRG